MTSRVWIFCFCSALKYWKFLQAVLLKTRLSVDTFRAVLTKVVVDILKTVLHAQQHRPAWAPIDPVNHHIANLANYALEQEKSKLTSPNSRCFGRHRQIKKEQRLERLTKYLKHRVSCNALKSLISGSVM
ncbi:hypothetical protein [Roseobacter sp. OBYS 0001]|uniref:hypothetical protein n=1 Tax=Roseobacter sp. OBYS 0001 TaxID=882651 RepID=UPI001C7F11E1|nr:hypothetical protein [Roseobacter sp. OBYS 0001]